MTDIVIALSAMFVTAGVLLLIANHFGLSPIPFYIIAGLLTGTLIAQPDLIALAQWGIAFLVFVFGIQVDFEDIQSVLRDGEVAAFTQLITVGALAFTIGYGLGVLFGFDDPFRNAIYFSAAATLSSTIIGAGVLEEEIRANLVHGRLASSIHFVDDMVAIGVLLILSAETLTDQQLIASNIGYGVVFLLAGIVLYRHGFPLLVRFADGFDELILMGSISILIGFIAAAEAVGISIVIGAFAAGIAIRSDGADALGVQNGIQSIRDFFATIFFVTVGALVQVPTMETILLSLTLIVLVLIVSPLVHTIAFIVEGYDSRTAFLASSTLNQMSELSLVIAIQAFIIGTISTRLFDAIILAAASTMILTVLTRRYETVLYDRIISSMFAGLQTRYTDEHSDVADDLSDHIVVVGYGRQGRLLVDKLEELDKPYVVIENDPVIFDELETDCRNYVFGDVMAEHTIERARVNDARLIVSTARYPSVSQSLLDLRVDTELILRAGSSHHAQALLDAGAMYVNVPSVLASDQLVETIERILRDDTEAPSLKSDHLDTLNELERRGFTTRFDHA